MLASALASRVWLFHQLKHTEIPPFYYDPACCSPYQLAHSARADVEFAGCVTLLAFAVALLRRVSARFLEQSAARSSLGVHLATLLGLLCIGLVHAAYYEVAFTLHAQLDFALVHDALRNGFGFNQLLTYCSPADALLVLAPVAAHVLIRAQRMRARALQGLVAIGCALAVCAVPDPGWHAPPAQLSVNPAAALLVSAIEEWNAPKPFARFDILPAPRDLLELGVGDPSAAPSRASVAPGPPSASVVIVILESVGGRYAFDGQGPEVMPNLSALRDQSLFLANHLSTANNSTNALFSIFTGLYPSPQDPALPSRADLRLPVLHQYPGTLREAFLYTPGQLGYYFPWGLLKASNLELHDRDSLGIAQPRPAQWGMADERDGVDAFLARLARARAPFFAAYYSGAAHHPYFDYGPEFRVRHPMGVPFVRYVNNLRLLDTQLGRVIEAVRARPEPTLLVVLGDHGEAFGQHPDNFGHSERSFQENFETFALLHLPGRFPRQVIHERTVHIDLTPTILAGLGIPFDARQFQGRDVLGQSPPRAAIYLTGNEGTLSSIDASDLELQLLYSSGECRAFDLARDPEQLAPLGCAALGAQMRRTGMFHAFQPHVLEVLQRRAQPIKSPCIDTR